MRRSAVPRKRTSAAASLTGDNSTTFKPPRRVTPKLAGMDLSALGHDDEPESPVSPPRAVVPSPSTPALHDGSGSTPSSVPKRTFARRVPAGNFKAPTRLAQAPERPPSPPSPRPQTPGVTPILRQVSVTVGASGSNVTQHSSERDGLISPVLPEPPLRRKKSVTIVPPTSPRLTRSVSRSRASRENSDGLVTPQRSTEMATVVCAPESVLPPSPPRIRRPNLSSSAPTQDMKPPDSPVLVDAASLIPPDSDDDVDYYGSAGSNDGLWASASPAVYPSTSSQYHLLASMSVTPSRGRVLSSLASPTGSEQVVLSGSGTLIGSGSVTSCLSARSQTPFGSSVVMSQAVETGEFGDYNAATQHAPACVVRPSVVGGDYVTNPNLNTSLVSPVPAAIRSSVNSVEMIDRDVAVFSPPPTAGPLLRPPIQPSPAQTPTASLPSTPLPSVLPREVRTVLSILPHLPDVVCAYSRAGITSLYPWQSDCVSFPDVLAGRNLLYTAPTSGGKTLVAELLMVHRILKTHRKALFVVPYVSIAREKTAYFHSLFGPKPSSTSQGLKVKGYYGLQGGDTLGSTDIAVCTIEKANAVINKSLASGKLYELGIIVLDEVHMVNEAFRGYILELIASKVVYAREHGVCDTQIVAMSATLPNAAQVATWLHARLHETDFRPVRLEEGIKVGDLIMSWNGEIVRRLAPVSKGGPFDPDHVVTLTAETVAKNGQVLVFCATKNSCEQVATNLCESLEAVLIRNHGPLPVSKAVVDRRRQLAVKLPRIAKFVASGVMFHHSGLSDDERSEVESAYLNGTLVVLCATSTLAAGINLPARRVIFRTPYIGKQFLDVAKYRQMAGRAGRKGYDSIGQSILICTQKDLDKCKQLLHAPLPPLRSALVDVCLLPVSDSHIVSPDTMQSGSVRGFTKLILELVASRLCKTTVEVAVAASSSLLLTLSPCYKQWIPSVIAYLLSSECIATKARATKLDFSRLTTSAIAVHSTGLGDAIFTSGLCPEEGLSVFASLQRASSCFITEHPLHMLYLVTPVYGLVEPDWPSMLELICSHTLLGDPSPVAKICQLVGCQSELLRKCQVTAAPPKVNAPLNRHCVLCSGCLPNVAEDCPFAVRTVTSVASSSKPTSKHVHPSTVTVDDVAIHRRLFSAILLYRMTFEEPMAVTSSRFRVPIGTLEQLRKSAYSFAGMVDAFCEQLNWRFFVGIFDDLRRRLQCDYPPRLRQFTRLRWMTPERAFLVHSQGWKTVSHLASVSPSDLAQLLLLHAPWKCADWLNSQTSSQHSGELTVSQTVAKVMKKTRSAGKRHVIGKLAVEIISEAQRHVGRLEDTAVNPVGAESATEVPTQEDVCESGLFEDGFEETLQDWTDDEPSDMDVVLSESEDDSEASRVQDVDDGGISGDDWMWSLTHEVAETQAGIKTPLASTLVRLQRRQQARVLAVQRLIDTSMAHDETRSCVESPVRTLDVRSHADDVSTDHTALLSTQDDVVKKLVFTLSQVGPTTSESCQCGDWLGLSDRLASSIQSVTSSVAFAFQMVTEKVESIEVSHPHVQCVLCLRQQFSIRCDATPRRRPVESLHSYFTTSHCETLVGVHIRWGLHVTQQVFLAIPRTLSFRKHRQTSPRYASMSQLALPIRVAMRICAFVGSCEEPESWKPLSLVNTAWRFCVIECHSLSHLWLRQQRWNVIRSLFENARSMKVAPGIKSQILEMRRFGVEVNGLLCDYEVGHWLLSPDEYSDTNCHAIATAHLNRPLIEDVLRCVPESRVNSDACQLSIGLSVNFGVPEAVTAAVSDLLGFARHYLDTKHLVKTDAVRFAAKTTAFNWLLSCAVLRSLYRAKLLRVFIAIEMPALSAVTDMEHTGCCVDTSLLASYSTMIQSRLEAVQRECDCIAKTHVNLHSPGDIFSVVVDILKLLPVSDAPKSRMLDKSTIVTLARSHPFPALVVEYRQLFAAQATYIKSLQTACVETRSSTSVFPTFDYHTSTGRLKCLRPNLQGLPDCVASSALGCVANLRKCIVSSPDSVLLSLDYSQIELRLAAHLSKDPLLCQLLTAGGDVLLLVATVWTGKSVEDITADDRQRTKQIVYGIMYGVSCHEVASMTGMAMQEAMRVIEVFKHSFKGLTSFSDAMVSFCRKTGYVETLFGRRRYLPNINSSNVKDKRRAERQAVNSAIQGSGADLIKIAMEATRNQLRAASLGPMCRLVMQIHDELVFEVNQDVIASVATIVQRVMTHCVTLSVPLLVKMAVGRSWGDLTPYSPP